MEQISVLNKRGLVLSGVIHKSNYDKIIILVHGYTGDKSEGGKFDLTANVLFNQGISVLQFDFSGCGESQDSSLRLDYLIDDIKTIINYVKSNGFKKVGLLGYSLGALISIIVSREESIKSLVLWSPLTSSINLKKRYSKLQIDKMEEDGYMILKKLRKNKQSFVIDKSFFDKLNSINQKSLLKNLKIPILFIHGEKDKIIPINESKKATMILPDYHKLIIVNDNHNLEKELNFIVNQSVRWFKEF